MASGLDNRAVSNHRILRHDDDAVANEVRAAGSVSLGHVRLVQQSRVLSDARVLVDDGMLDYSSLTYPNARQTLAGVAAHLVKRLVVISAHPERRIYLHAFRNPAAQPDDRIVYLCAVDDGAVADDRIVDLALLDFRRRQVARAREHRRFSIKQIELRNLARQIQIPKFNLFD